MMTPYRANRVLCILHNVELLEQILHIAIELAERIV